MYHLRSWDTNNFTLKLYRQLPRDEQRAIQEKRHVADRRDYALTLELAENSRDPWSGDEDQYILEHWGEPAREIALELGCTLWVIRSRRMRLRRMNNPIFSRQKPPVSPTGGFWFVYFSSANYKNIL